LSVRYRIPHDRALALAPDNLGAHTNKGNALQCLGKVQAALAQSTEAIASLEAALAAYIRDHLILLLTMQTFVSYETDCTRRCVPYAKGSPHSS
jgi:hypothetical protein